MLAIFPDFASIAELGNMHFGKSQLKMFDTLTLGEQVALMTLREELMSAPD